MSFLLLKKLDQPDRSSVSTYPQYVLQLLPNSGHPYRSLQDMIALARKNAGKEGLKPPQVSFVQASLVEPLPIESESVDCILSNCVINLLPSEEKGKLFKEMHRILKKGGRVVLDDVSIFILCSRLHLQ